MWVKETLTTDFLSESCTFADIDGDGDLELVAGDYWWRIYPPYSKKKFRTVLPAWLPEWPHDPCLDPHPGLRRGGGNAQYRDSTYDWGVDISGNGLPDVIWVGMHKNPILWCENSGNNTDEWPTHIIAEGGIYESCVYTDEIVKGRPSLVTIPRKNQIAWYEPADNPRERWVPHIIGNEGGDWHGLGVGDIDGDGKVEVISKNIIYHQTDDPRQPWDKKKITQVLENGETMIGLGDVFIIHVTTSTHGEHADLVSASPHGLGLWWWEFVEETQTEQVYRRHSISTSVSQLHSLNIVSLDDDNIGKMIVTGKRWHAHGSDGDVYPNDPASLFAVRARKGSWEHPLIDLIDNDSGVGIKFDSCIDKDGAILIATSNKKGVYLHRQCIE